MINSLSVFFPTYNEEGNIINTVLKTRNKLLKTFDKWEIIIVNDGSVDRTPKIAKELEKKDKRIRVISHEINRGYGASLKTGFYNAKYPWVCFTDSDGQFDFDEIDSFVKTQKETDADMVIGYYRDRKVSTFKKITSKMWEYLVYFMFGLKVKDIDCGFKLISKKVIDALPDLESERGAFISSEFLIKAKKKKFKIVEIPVTHLPRLEGKGTGRDIKVIINSFRDLFKLWIKLNFL